MSCRYYFGYRIASYKMANVDVSDARVLRMHEVLLAIKLVKFYVWERSFARQVEEVGARAAQSCAAVTQLEKTACATKVYSKAAAWQPETLQDLQQLALCQCA